MKYSNKNIKHIYPGESPKLPDEYQEVEWLQSDGNAHIDTGVKPTISDTITSVFKGTFNDNTSNVIYSSVYGGWNASPNNWFMLRFYQSSTDYSLNIWHRIGVGTKINLKPAKKIDGTNIHTVVVSQRDNQCTINIDGVSESITVSSGAIESDQPNYWLLSYVRTSGPVETGNTIKLYRWTLQHNNDILVRDFVPCYRKSDNEPGMYDLVNNVFYTNAYSDGEFIVGTDVKYKKVLHIEDEHGTVFNDVPVGYTKLDYIETNGTNYIDTGLKVNNSDMFEFEAKWERLSLTEFTGLFWYRTQTGNNYPSIMCILNYNANGDNFRLANYANGNTTINKVSNTSGTNTVYYKTVGNRCNINGTGYTYAYQIYNYSNMPDFDFYFPARNLQGTDTEGYKFYAVRVYFFNIYNKTTGQPLRLFVPAKQDSTGKIGMLELKSGTFYERQGTGEFGYRESNTGTVVQPT